MEGKKYKGKVKGIPNAGAVLLQGPLKDGIPQEKTIVFNGVTVPALGDLEKPDEPFAFEARELLRKLVVGKEVEFYIETKIHEREFGRVLYDGEDVAITLIREGYAKPMENLKTKPLNYDKYAEASNQAQKAGRGMWATGSEAHKKAIRTLIEIEDPQKVLEKYKGAKLTGIVEEFRTGPFKVYSPLLETIVELALPGLIIPITNSRTAQDYRMFVEFTFLHRDVEFKLLGYDEKHETFIGEIKSLENPNFNISIELVKHGFAKLSPNAVLELDAEHYKQLKQNLDDAQSKQLRLWTDFKNENKKTSVPSAQGSKEFFAKVLEVHSGDSLTLENLNKYEIVRVYLANIRAPQIGKKNEADQPFAFEAKEFVRKNSIGKKVKVEIEFIKPIKVKTEGGGEESKNYTFVSVILPNDKNLAELIVENGLAKVNMPRQDEDFSKYLKALKEAEDRSVDSKLGTNSKNPPLSISKYNDLTQQKVAKKVKTFFDLIKDDPKLAGVVEAVLSGSLYKVRLDKQNCFVLLSIAGLRTLQSDKNIEQYDKFSKQATRFAKENLLQRDVEIEPIGVTPKGVIQANILVNKRNFGLFLLEVGLAYVDALAKQIPLRIINEFKPIEDKAKEQKLGIWGANLQLGISGRGSNFKIINETKNVVVSEINDANEFYVQFTDNKYLDAIHKELDTFKGETEPKLELPVKVGTPCLCKFSLDKQWYRARIEKQIRENKYGVHFLDYGNYDEVDVNSLRKIPASLLQYEDQAKKSGLAFLRTPGYDHDSGEKAGNLFKELTWEKKMTATFYYEDSRKKYCVLTERGGTDPKKSVNYVLISKGLAKIDKSATELPESLKLWEEEEEAVSEKKLGIWATNELSDEEEDY